MSSSSVATYHLSKLEDAGLLKRQEGGFSVNKFLLENSIKISRFLIPRYFFYSIFALAVLILELTVMMPASLYREYVFSVIATAVFVFSLFMKQQKLGLEGICK